MDAERRTHLRYVSTWRDLSPAEGSELLDALDEAEEQGRQAIALLRQMAAQEARHRTSRTLPHRRRINARVRFDLLSRISNRLEKIFQQPAPEEAP